MLAALVMTIWSRFVCVNNIDAAIYIDDRTFWHVGDAGPERVNELLQAHQQSSRFDFIFSFQCRPAKCKIACLPSADGSRLARTFGYYSSHVLQVLGVDIVFILVAVRSPDCPWRPSKRRCSFSNLWLPQFGVAGTFFSP